MKILKFGGSSVGSAERIAAVAEIIKAAMREGPLAVVVSAMEGVTNDLIRLAREASTGHPATAAELQALISRHSEAAGLLLPPQERSNFLVTFKVLSNELEDLLHGVSLLRELSPRSLDLIMSFGERFSALLLSHAMSAGGTPAEMLDSRTVVKTSDAFGSASYLPDQTYPLIRRRFAESKSLQIVTGFIGSTLNDHTTTLGRGGSDLTATIFGAALAASEVEIWTDVDGIMTADPRKVPEAFSISELTYEEAMELSHFGAKVIYPPTMQPALDNGIPIRVRNSFHPAFPGTIIKRELSRTAAAITAVTSIEHIALLQVKGSGLIGVAGVSSRLFGALARAQISVILISQASSEHTICFAVTPADAEPARRVLEAEFAAEIALRSVQEITVELGLSVISAVGENMRDTPGISGRLFSALGRNGVNVTAIAQGSSELNISAVIQTADERKALNAIHEQFFLSERTTIHLFLAGTGLIGKTLLRQIAAQQTHLERNLALRLRVVGITNSRRMIFDTAGLDLEHWNSVLDSGDPADLSLFIGRMRQLNLPNTVFVDCTASERVASSYGEILNASIHVVTPNKKAQSGPPEAVAALQRTARKRGVAFLYEASVGAGLPVIGTLRDLLVSGDRIDSIEAVLSGTLSFIFNTVQPDIPFSSVVREAAQKGLTEPDPREDLSGRDVGRKLLILAREMHLTLSEADITVESLVPKECDAAESAEELYAALARHDAAMAKRLHHAAASGAKLCYVATLKDGAGDVMLREIPPDHPFAALSGTDNIILFRTDRYQERPLVVQGPGAGAEVTAGAVFADVIRAANSSRV